MTNMLTVKDAITLPYSDDIAIDVSGNSSLLYSWLTMSQIAANPFKIGISKKAYNQGYR